MKLTISETVKREIDIEFPYYTEDQGTYCKFTEKGVGIFFRNGCQTAITKGIIPESWILFRAITAEEFDKKFVETLKAIQS